MTPDPRPLRVAALFIAALVAFGCRATSRHSGEGEASWVAVGDWVSVTGTCDENLIADTVCVDESGFVLVPGIGQVRVAGLTAAEITSAMLAKCDALGLHARVQVDVTIGAPRYSVFGAVERRGAIPLQGDVTVAEAVAAALPTPTARLTGVALFRPTSGNSQEFQRFELEGRETEKLRWDFSLRNEDVLFVPWANRSNEPDEPIERGVLLAVDSK